MASQPVVRVVGARELRAAMRRAGHDLADLKDVNADVAQLASRQARTDAPRLTGRLAGTVRPGATQSAAILRAGGRSVPYAAVIHWGWPARHIAPHPFLVQAAEETEPSWLALYRRAVDELLARVERSTP